MVLTVHVAQLLPRGGFVSRRAPGVRIHAFAINARFPSSSYWRFERTWRLWL